MTPWCIFALLVVPLLLPFQLIEAPAGGNMRPEPFVSIHLESEFLVGEPVTIRIYVHNPTAWDLRFTLTGACPSNGFVEIAKGDDVRYENHGDGPCLAVLVDVVLPARSVQSLLEDEWTPTEEGLYTVTAGLLGRQLLAVKPFAIDAAPPPTPAPVTANPLPYAIAAVAATAFSLWVLRRRRHPG